MVLAACSRKAPLLRAARAAQERGEWAEALRAFTAAGDSYGAALAQAQVPEERGAHLTGARDVSFTSDGRALLLLGTSVRDALTGAEVARVDGPASLQRDWLVRRSSTQVRATSLVAAAPFNNLEPGGGEPILLEAAAEARVSIADDGRGAAVYRDGLWLVARGGARVQVFAGPPTAQLQLAGALAAVRTDDGALQLWSTVDRKLVLRREGVGEIFALSSDARAIAWQDSAGLHLAAIDERSDTVLDQATGATRLAWSRDGALLGACGDELRIYDAVERRLAHRLPESGPCALSDDGHAVLAGGRLFTLPAQPPHPHRSAGLVGAAFARGELVTLGAEGLVASWDVPSGEEHANAWVHEKSPCGSSGLAAAAGRVAAGGAVWKPGGAGFEKLAEVPGEVAATALAVDALIVSSWPPGRGLRRGPMECCGTGPVAGRADPAATITTFEVRTGATRWRLDAFACTLASDGVRVAAGGRDGSLVLLDATTGASLRTLAPLRGPVRALTFSPDAQSLAAAADEPVIIIYSMADTGKQILKTTSPPRSIAFSRDGALLAAGGEDGVVSLWELTGRLNGELKQGSSRATLPALRGPVSAVAFSADGAWLASGTAAFGGARLTHLPNR